VMMMRDDIMQQIENNQADKKKRYEPSPLH
jgi:hypothetical protein